MTQIVLAARGRITTHFGEDIGRGFPHRGIDQGHGDGLPVDLEIRAPADGTVTFAGLFGSYGLVLFITHDDGWVSVLAHHAKHFVTKGERVTRGQLVAVMGNSGTVYVHNHQELRDAAGAQLDPLLHLGTGTTTSALGGSEITDLPAKPTTPLSKGHTMRLVAGQPSNRRFALGELTYQELPGEQASHSAHVWESPAGGLAHGEPLVVDDATLDLEIGQIQQRRAQLAGAFNSLRA